MDARARERLFAVVVVAGASLLCVLAIEAGGRLLGGRRWLDTDLRLRSGRLVYEPGQEQRWRRLEWDVHYRINSEGFRDREPEPPGRPAVLALGDSFTEGYGVEIDDGYVRRVEAGLAAAGKPFLVLNAGLQARSLSNYVRLYEDRFSGRGDIGLVLMGFETTTDVEERASEGYVEPPGRGTPVYALKRFLSERSILYNLVRRPLRGSRPLSRLLMGLGVMGRVEGWTLAVGARNKPAWEDSARRVRAFRDRLRAQGKDFVLILLPQREQVDAPYFEHMLRVTGLPRSMFEDGNFYDFMLDYAREHGIAAVSLREPLLAAERERPGCCFFKTDNHWNAQGHAVVARAVLEGLSKAGLPRAVKRR